MVSRIALTLALLFTLTGCGPADMKVKSVTLQPDYPAYENLAALYAKADLVAIVQLAPRTEVRAPGEIPAATTVFTGRVQRTFKGRADAELQVKQLGGTYDGTTYREAGTIPLEPGARYLVFVEVYAESPASLLNPSQGQYRVGADDQPQPVAPEGLRFTLADLERLGS